MSDDSAGSVASSMEGSHGFDFLFGRWHVSNERIRDPFVDGPPRWDTFESYSECRPILGGIGNIETYSSPDFPGRGKFEGMTLRLYAPLSNVWRIWWASTSGAGELDTPVVGQFENGSGSFECIDQLNDRRVRVRYDWKDITPDSATWEQSFSFDEATSWTRNWTMKLERLG